MNSQQEIAVENLCASTPSTEEAARPNQATSSSSKRKGVEIEQRLEEAKARESSCAASLNYSDDTAATLFPELEDDDRRSSRPSQKQRGRSKKKKRLNPGTHQQYDEDRGEEASHTTCLYQLPSLFRPPLLSPNERDEERRDAAQYFHARGNHHVIGPPTAEPFAAISAQLLNTTAADLAEAVEEICPRQPGRIDPSGSTIIQAIADATNRAIAAWTILVGTYREEYGTKSTMLTLYKPLAQSSPSLLVERISAEALLVAKLITPQHGNVYAALAAPAQTFVGEARAKRPVLPKH